MDDRIRKSLGYSLKEGVFASIMLGISENFMTPYALAMKASVGMIGILASMPHLIGSLIQINSASLVERLGSRKKLINSGVFIQALTWLPIMSVPYLFEANRAIYLIIFYTFFVAIGTIAFPAWSSLMADHVSETERGKVFGWRNRLFGIINCSAIFIAGYILYLSKKMAGEKAAYLGFTIIFFAAFIARLCSWYFLTKMHEPPLAIKDEHRFSFLDFLKRLRKSNFGRFAIFVASMNFSVYLASPFFSVYMLKDLKFNYLAYTIVHMTATLTVILMMNSWGLHADRVGNRRVLRLTSIFIPFIPMLWLFSHNLVYLIFVQIFAGFFWSGFNLSASNFIYDAVTPQKRTRCIAYFNVINGFAMFSGAMIGGSLVKVLPSLLGYRMLTLLVISGILRLFAAVFCSFIKEVRQVRETSNLELFYSIVGLRPII